MSGRNEVLYVPDHVTRVAVGRKEERRTASGAVIAEPDWFLKEAAGVREPEHPGETMTEYRARKAQEMRVYKAVAIGCAVLLAVAFALKSWVG